MLTRLKVKNFKRLTDVEIELGKSVVFIGPNNSGKTTALQSLALWDVGLRQWKAKRGGKASPEKRPGVTINRRDLISVPVPAANLLWRDLHVREGYKAEGEPRTANIRIEITVDGVTGDRAWSCGLEFDYSNEESFVCRPLRLPGYEDRPIKEAKFSTIPEEAVGTKMAFLPPMSGLADREYLKQSGEIDFLLGQGQTAQVLRNLCYRIHTEKGKDVWEDLTARTESIFGIHLRPPLYIAERGEITMEYDEDHTTLDISSSGRGLQQTLLLMAHLLGNPGTVLLLDEPDAHLEILRQRQTYQLLTEMASEMNSQIVAASHSEVVLSEAADRDMVIAFVGKPHRIDDRGSQVMKSLKEIGLEQYYQAEQTGWVLYLEGSTDLAILLALARKLHHEAAECLDRAFFHAVGNQPGLARSHFHGLCEAKKDLAGIAIFDRLDRDLPADLGAKGLVWRRREIENYLCMPEVLRAYARDACGGELGELFVPQWEAKMDEIIKDVVPPVALRDPKDAWWINTKVTNDFLDPLFQRFFRELGLPNLMRKTDYHVLTKYVAPEAVDPEVREKLDAILEIAKKASPRTD